MWNDLKSNVSVKSKMILAFVSAFISFFEYLWSQVYDYFFHLIPYFHQNEERYLLTMDCNGMHNCNSANYFQCYI